MANRYVTYNTSVDAGTPNIHNVLNDLDGRTPKSGAIVYDGGGGDLIIYIDEDHNQILLKENEVLDLTGAEISKVSIDVASGTGNYRFLMTIWDVN